MKTTLITVSILALVYIYFTISFRLTEKKGAMQANCRVPSKALAIAFRIFDA